MSHFIKNSSLKSVSFIMITGLLSFILLPISVGAITFPGGGTGTSPSFTTTQQATLNLINSAINKLNAAENKIQNNPSLSPSTKTSILNDLNGIEAQLLASKTAVEQATTNAELQVVSQEVSSYLKTNKDVIKNDFTLAITEIGASASAKAKAYEEQIQQLLTVLAVTCPSQSSTIATLTAQITQLETEIIALNSAIKSKNAVTIKVEMKKISTLMKSMSKNVKTIQTSCNIPTI